MPDNTTTSCIPTAGGTQGKFGAWHPCVAIFKEANEIMNRILIGLLVCLMVVSCSKNAKGKAFDLEQVEQKDENIIQIQTLDGIDLPKLEISRESLLAGFPENPDYFIENSINVTIERIDERSSQTPAYFGLEPVYVTGDNFKIIYATDNGYEVRLVNLKGKSVFSYWNQYFDATWDDVIKSWGPPSRAESRAYDDSTGWYFVAFSVDKMTGKIKEIQIGRAL
jgi:hypothetical protein